MYTVTKKSLSLLLTALLLFSEITVPFTYAAQLNGGNLIQPNVAVKPQTPFEKAVSRLSSKKLKAEVLGLADFSNAQPSAHKKIPLKVQKLEQLDYKADEDITITVNNPDDETFTTKVVNAEGEEVPAEIQQTDTGTTTEIQIISSNQMTPGKYTVEVTDQSGTSTTQDFTWGVLAINADKSIYLRNETANIAIAVLDENGNMVCNAEVTLSVTKPDGTIDTLLTSNSKIRVNPECQKKEFTLKPDYEAQYQLGGPGTYGLQLKAQTANGTYVIGDSLIVRESISFDVKRTGPTRIYPPLHYPVTFEITANQDFTGTITETVPESFTITPAEEADSYDNMNTVYLNSQKDPAQQLNKNILGAATGGLVMPFEGSFAVSQGFGSELTDSALKDFYSHYGLGGHDGIDFALPAGTPLYAVDDGNILLAGDGDYGTTIVMQHSWGRSYYGHLSKVSVSAEQHVKKGTVIGYSGNTGESTGPHLHFGIKPNTPDTGNNYMGKIDPLPYLPVNGFIAKTFDLNNLEAVLGASDSAQTLSPDTAEPASEPIIAEPAANQTEIKPLDEKLQKTSTENDLAAYTVQNDIIRQEVAYSESPKVEKVKVITWELSLKKGEKKTLSYTYKAPQESPQFYLTGPLKFFDKSTGTVIFEEARKWQIAADAVGVDWYNKSWDYRKPITIDSDQVGTSDPWCNDTTGVTCTSSWQYRKKITINNSASATNLTDFPLLVKLNSGRITYANTQSAGQDIRFVDPSDPNTVLNHEIEEYNETGDDYIWVKIPQIDAASTTDYIWMYYGNAGASSPATELGTSAHATGTWNSNYRGIWHLHESSGNAGDSTTYSTTLTKLGTPLQNQTGQIGPAVDFNNNYLNSFTVSDPGDGHLDFGTSDFSYGLWVNVDADTADFQIPIHKGGTGFDEPGYDIEFNTEESIAPNLADGVDHVQSGSDGVLTYGNWIHIYAVVDNTNNLLRLYQNGVEVDTGTDMSAIGSVNNTEQFNIGGLDNEGSTYNYDGKIDEVRVVSGDLSADWIEAEYLTTTDAMNTFGSEEGQTVTLTNFPVLINLTTDTDLAARAQANGDDILFTDSTGITKLSHEIESYNSGTGALAAWVKLPTLYSSTGMDIYMYYGNPAATNQEDATNVWDSNYRASWHMSEGSGTNAADSTSYANDLTLSTSSWTTSGKISTAWNGVATNWLNQVVDDNDFDFAAAGTPTISMWFKSDAAGNPGATQWLINKSLHGGAQTAGYAVYAKTSGVVCFGIDDDTTWTPDDEVCSSSDIYDGTWHYLSALKNGATSITLYIDGIAVNIDSSLAATGTLENARIFDVGDRQGTDGSDEFAGDIDQLTVSVINRAEAWIVTEYNNQNSPGTFYTLGSQETYQYAPTNEELMRHGNFFDSRGAEQPFAY